MKLRSGAVVAQSSISQNPKMFQAIAEHNAFSPLLKLPQEIKNRIYEYVLGGHMVHILQVDSEYHHVHDSTTASLSHAICIEHLSEEQVQKDFDSADPDDDLWSIAAVENRHGICYERPLKKKGKVTQHRQLSLTLLRSCRQIYLEANTVHYKTNTFAFNCGEAFERFVRARYQNKQHLAIRSLYLSVSVIHVSTVGAWSDLFDKTLLKRLKSVRSLHLNLVQLYCTCSVDAFTYEGSKMSARQRDMFKRLGKLPLREATFLVDDSIFWNSCESDVMTLEELEDLYRWTIGQKEFSREIRGALLGWGTQGKGKEM